MSTKKMNEKWLRLIRMIPEHSEKTLQAIVGKYSGWELHQKLRDYFFKVNEASTPDMSVPPDLEEAVNDPIWERLASKYDPSKTYAKDELPEGASDWLKRVKEISDRIDKA